MGKQHIICYVAIIAIVIIETVALLHGINGVALSTSVGAISFIGGHTVSKNT